jgi:hypothetical protein
MVINRGLRIRVRNRVLSFKENSLNSLEILFELFDHFDHSLLDLFLDQRSLKHNIEKLDDFKTIDQILRVIQRLNDDRCNSSFELFDLLSEDVKLVLELLHIGVHYVVAQVGKSLAGHHELIVNLLD